MSSLVHVSRKVFGTIALRKKDVLYDDVRVSNYHNNLHDENIRKVVKLSDHLITTPTHASRNKTTVLRNQEGSFSLE